MLEASEVCSRVKKGDIIALCKAICSAQVITIESETWADGHDGLLSMVHSNGGPSVSTPLT
jgi:hypothetical protein